MIDTSSTINGGFQPFVHEIDLGQRRIIYASGTQWHNTVFIVTNLATLNQSVHA